MSNEQRKKISEVQTILNKKIVHNDKFKLSYWMYLDYFNEFDSFDWKEKKVDYGFNKKFFKIVHELKIDLINEDFFEYEKFFFHPSCISKKRKILNPGFFDMCEPILIDWHKNPNFKEDLKKFIIENKNKINEYCRKYLK